MHGPLLPDPTRAGKDEVILHLTGQSTQTEKSPFWIGTDVVQIIHLVAHL